MAIRKRKGSPFYLYDFTVKGYRFRGSTGTDDPKLARALEAKLRNEAFMQQNFDRLEEMTLDAACGNHWLGYAQHLKYRGAIKTHCLHLLRIIGKTALLHEISDSDIARYVSTRRSEKVGWNNNSQRLVSPATINRELATLQSIFRRQARKKVAIATIDWSAHRLKESKCMPRYLTPEEVDSILGQMKYHYQRHATRAALYTGFRKGNILTLHSRQIDWENAIITVRSKSRDPEGKIHSVPMIPALQDMLAQEMGIDRNYKGYIFRHENGEPFKDLRRGFKAAADRAGIPEARWHDLRHTCASWLVQKGISLQVVQQVLGHENITTTMRYAHLDQQIKREAMEKLSAQIRHSDKNEEENLEKLANKLLEKLGINGASDGDRTHGLQCHKLQDTAENISKFQELKQLLEFFCNGTNTGISEDVG